MFPWPHSSHKQQSPPSDLCSPQCPSLQHWEEEQKHVLIGIQALLNICWPLPVFRGFECSRNWELNLCSLPIKGFIATGLICCLIHNKRNKKLYSALNCTELTMLYCSFTFQKSVSQFALYHPEVCENEKSMNCVTLGRQKAKLV